MLIGYHDWNQECFSLKINEPKARGALCERPPFWSSAVVGMQKAALATSRHYTHADRNATASHSFTSRLTADEGLLCFYSLCLGCKFRFWMGQDHLLTTGTKSVIYEWIIPTQPRGECSFVTSSVCTQHGKLQISLKEDTGIRELCPKKQRPHAGWQDPAFCANSR